MAPKPRSWTIMRRGARLRRESRAEGLCVEHRECGVEAWLDGSGGDP